MERKWQFWRCFALAFMSAVFARDILCLQFHVGPYLSLYITALLGEVAYEVFILKDSKIWWRLLRVSVLPLAVFVVAAALQFVQLAIIKAPGGWPVAIPIFFMGILLDQSVEYQPTDGELATWIIPGALCCVINFFG